MYRYSSNHRFVLPVSEYHPRVGTSSYYQNYEYGGTAGKTKYRSADGSRAKPVDLFAGTTNMVVYESNEVNPQMTRVVTDANGINIINHMASVSANALNAYPTDELPVAIAQARNKILAKIKDQNLNLAVSLAEYRSTATTVGDFARSAARVLVQPKMKLGLKLARRLARRNSDPWSRRLRYSKLSRREMDAVNAYLGYTYGLRPIMSDIKGSIEALNKRLESSYYKITTAKASHTTNKSVSLPAYSDPIWDTRRTANGTAVHECRIKARYKVNSNVKSLAEVGITNPLSVAYEMIPYSFVLDWIIPVGGYLSSLDALVGIEELIWVQGVKTSVSCSSSTGHLYIDSYMGRSPASTTGLDFTLSYSPSDSLMAAFNGIALLKQRFP